MKWLLLLFLVMFVTAGFNGNAAEDEQSKKDVGTGIGMKLAVANEETEVMTLKLYNKKILLQNETFYLITATNERIKLFERREFLKIFINTILLTSVPHHFGVSEPLRRRSRHHFLAQAEEYRRGLPGQKG